MSNTIDIKLDINPEKIKEVAKSKQLSEIFTFIYDEFSKNPDWKSLDEYSQMILAEQAFIINFTKFPARIQLAAALALIEEDEAFSKLDIVEKNEIRSMIKNIGVSIKNDDKGEFIYDNNIIELAKELYKRIDNERVCKTLIGPEEFAKF